MHPIIEYLLIILYIIYIILLIIPMILHSLWNVILSLYSFYDSRLVQPVIILFDTAYMGDEASADYCIDKDSSVYGGRELWNDIWSEYGPYYIINRRINEYLNNKKGSIVLLLRLYQKIQGKVHDIHFSIFGRIFLKNKNFGY